MRSMLLLGNCSLRGMFKPIAEEYDGRGMSLENVHFVYSEVYSLKQ